MKKKIKDIIRATKQVAPTPIDETPKFDYITGPTISENPSGDTPYFEWHPDCNLLWVRHTPFGNTPHTSLDEICKFVKEAAKRGDMSITILTTDASGMFPTAIHITQKTSKLRIKSSTFCTPNNMDPQTYSRITKILEAMGGTAKDFYEARNEWFKRYNTLANDGKTHVVAEVMLNAELSAS